MYGPLDTVGFRALGKYKTPRRREWKGQLWRVHLLRFKECFGSAAGRLREYKKTGFTLQEEEQAGWRRESGEQAHWNINGIYVSAGAGGLQE